MLLQTYGNFHATLIGLFVKWWVTMSQEHSAMDSGPTYKYHKKGEGSIHCDALLFDDGNPVGVLEVEGIHPEQALDRICRFLDTEDGYWGPLQFGILVVYAYGPTGRGINRQIPDIKSEELEKLVERKTKPIYLVCVNKHYPGKESRNRDTHARFHSNSSEYYHGQIEKITVAQLTPKTSKTDPLLLLGVNNLP